ncbi:recombinase family protein [Asaia spathodeae]|uniref:Recombinase family protein n=1 Tax=Asaia spathodeae TaxID=657016 RepID=A0ABX2P6G6_9PROT|nr:recombinase family protein [Asaia spathodeae]GBR19666.1 DNA-invertase [Asaia spathodeae NBRC 105894]
MTRYGYARVSTDDQTHDPQLLALEREGVREIVFDTVSGGVPAASRPGLSELLERLQPGDSLVAARLDRLGRTMLDVMGLVGSLVDRQVRVRLLDVGIETGTANGQLFLTILAGFAEFERAIIRERTRAGLEAARRSGSRLGRPTRLTERRRRHVVELHKAGKSLHEIAQIMAVSKTTIWRAVSCGRKHSGNGGSGTDARAARSVRLTPAR